MEACLVLRHIDQVIDDTAFGPHDEVEIAEPDIKVDDDD